MRDFSAPFFRRAGVADKARGVPARGAPPPRARARARGRGAVALRGARQQPSLGGGACVCHAWRACRTACVSWV